MSLSAVSLVNKGRQIRATYHSQPHPIGHDTEDIRHTSPRKYSRFHRGTVTLDRTVRVGEQFVKYSYLSHLVICIRELADLDSLAHRNYQNNRDVRRIVDCCHNRRCRS